MATDELPRRVPGRTLRIEGDLQAPAGGWFGIADTSSATTSQPEEVAALEFAAPDMATMQRVLIGLINLLEQPDSHDFPWNQE